MNRVVIIMILLVFMNISPGQTYRYSGYLYQSSPEAGLFFSNPSYISPAQAYGVTGMFANPAALGFSSDYGLAFAFGTPAHPKIKCNLKVLDSTSTQTELKIPFQLGFKETGGINFLGISKKLGPIGIGFGYMQASKTGIGFDFNAQGDTFTINYSFEDTVEASYPGGDTMIPVTWLLAAPLALQGSGMGNFTLSKQPLFLGIGSGSGIGSLGIGLKIQKYSGMLDGNIYFGGGAELTGSGIAKPPYKGRVDAIATIPFDTLISAKGSGEASVNRTSLVAGGLIKTGIFKMGITLEKAFKTTLDGNLNFVSLMIESSSDSVITDSNTISFIYPDSIAGGIRLRTVKSTKKADTSGFQEAITLPGYTQIDFGISVLLFDLYLGCTIPQKGDINNFKVGTLFSVPLPMVTIRTGMLVNLDYYYSADKKIIPLRAPVYLGVGGSVKTKFTFLPIVPDAQIDFGIKSNTIPLFSKMILDLIEDNNPGALEQVTDIESPSFFSLLSFNLGIGLKI